MIVYGFRRLPVCNIKLEDLLILKISLFTILHVLAVAFTHSIALIHAMNFKKSNFNFYIYTLFLDHSVY